MFQLAPQVRLELTTLRLTAECSAIELLRNAASDIIAVRPVFRKGDYRLLYGNKKKNLLNSLEISLFYGLIDEVDFLLYNSRMERRTPHILYTERSEPKRTFIRTDGALYLVLLAGAFLAILLSRILSTRFGVSRLYVQIGLYAVLLGAGYLIYRTRMIDYIYELYDAEFCVVQAVGQKRKPLLTVPLAEVGEVGPFRKTDAKPTIRTYHGPRKDTTAICFTRDGQRYVACVCVSDTMKEKLSEALHAKE